MKEDTETSPFALLASDSAFDPLEDGVRQRVRRFIETILEEELQAVLGRGRYERSAEGATGHRNGHRERQVIDRGDRRREGNLRAQTPIARASRLPPRVGRSGVTAEPASPGLDGHAVFRLLRRDGEEGCELGTRIGPDG